MYFIAGIASFLVMYTSMLNKLKAARFEAKLWKEFCLSKDDIILLIHIVKIV